MECPIMSILRKDKEYRRGLSITQTFSNTVVNINVIYVYQISQGNLSLLAIS